MSVGTTLRRVVGVPLEPVREEQAEARFQEVMRQLSWLRHPDLVKPERLSIDLDVVYSWGPEPSPLGLKEHLQRTSPPLPILLGWVQELCSLVDECHQNQPPLILGRLNLSCLRWREQRPQLVGLVVTRQLQLGFESHDPSWCGPPEDELVPASDCWCLARLLLDMVAVAGQPARGQLAAYPELQNLLKLAMDPNPSRRPGRAGLLKARLERLPPPRKPRARWLDRPTPLWLSALQRRARPLWMSALLVSCALAAWQSWRNWQPPRSPQPLPSRLPRPQRPPRRPPAKLHWGPVSSPSPR